MVYEELILKTKELSNSKEKTELEKANSKLKSALRAKSEFLDIASHQLRTPTSIIRGMLSMILEDNLTEKEKMDFIEKSFQSANRLTVAKEKNLYLNLELPEQQTKKILADPERIRGVIEVDFEQNFNYKTKACIKLKK